MNRTDLRYSPRQPHTGTLFLCVLAAACLAADFLPAEERGVLQLINGSFVQGHLADAAAADTLTWQGSQFTAPFRFPLSSVHAIVYPQPAELQQPRGEFCFELSGGAVLFGGLHSITEETISIHESKLGLIALRRDRVRRFFRWNAGADLIFSGPTGLKGWTEKSSEPNWRDQGGQLTTDQPHALLSADFKLPPQVIIEWEVSWKKRPNFALIMGSSDRAESLKDAFRLEVIDSELVALRETKRTGDVAVVTPLGTGEGRLHFLTYLDQARGRLLIYSLAGVQIAEISATEPDPNIGGGIALMNIEGDLQLDRLRISRWNGVPPTSSAGAQQRFQRGDGAAQEARLSGYDADQHQVQFCSGEEVLSVPVDQLDDVVLSPVEENPAEAESRGLHLVYHDGTRLSGELTMMSADRIGMTCPEIIEPLTAPVKDLRGITWLQTKLLAATALPPREVLELSDTRLRGQLVAGRELPEASCLTWQPEHSELASPLRTNITGRIVYKSPPKKTKTSQRNPVNRNRQAQALPRLLNIQKAQADEPPAKGAPRLNSKNLRFLHLRSGDTIPCEVQSIDERGVAFETPLSDATFVSHDQVKAVELAKVSNQTKLTAKKRDRLLTLPRMQRDSPPQQLIWSPNGDLLRGRVLAMSETHLKVEVRLDARELARDRVAQIIWLHPDELTPAPSAAKSPLEPPPRGTSTRVQVLRSDGIRLTFFADQFADGTLSGKSAVLGDCRSELAQVDQLLIGDAIELAAATLPWHRWKLHHAIDPKFVTEENGETAPGQDSPLVGKPAPDFKLEFLDGKQFHLADCQGQIVVLDFWATWCGPCLQVMPQIETVVGEFQDRNVRLVAVNLEESPKQIAATLERHKLDVPVVLDQDGVVAHKYAATAIPQTVVIDSRGMIFRIFVGGGPDYAEQLRAALTQVTQPATPAANPVSDEKPQGLNE